MDENNVFIFLASGLLSLLFFYVSGFKTWYEKKSQEGKQLIMVAAISVMVVGDYGLKLYQQTVVLGVPSALVALSTWVIALAVNAGMYRSIRYIGNKT